MARCPIVRPETVRVSLSEGDFLDLKKRLNTGEYRHMLQAQFKDVSAGEKAVINLEQMGLSKVLAYVVGWSFVDLEGKPLPFSEATLRLCDPAVFTEILTAVEAHDDAVEQARAAEKNDQGGESKTSATLPSAA